MPRFHEDAESYDQAWHEAALAAKAHIARLTTGKGATLSALNSATLILKRAQDARLALMRGSLQGNNQETSRDQQPYDPRLEGDVSHTLAVTCDDDPESGGDERTL
jgi:hypothetical protein